MRRESVQNTGGRGDHTPLLFSKKKKEKRAPSSKILKKEEVKELGKTSREKRGKRAFPLSPRKKKKRGNWSLIPIKGKKKVKGGR